MMIRRRHFLASLVTLSGVVSIQRSASAGLFDFLNETPTETQSAAPQPPRSLDSNKEFQEVYDEASSLSREQFARLQRGEVNHWSDLAQPYARLKSNDGLEHYYYRFGFGEGGVILISDTSGIVQNWAIAPNKIAPAFNPADTSEYIYYPPKETAAAVDNQASCTP